MPSLVGRTFEGRVGGVMVSFSFCRVRAAGVWPCSVARVQLVSDTGTRGWEERFNHVWHMPADQEHLDMTHDLLPGGQATFHFPEQGDLVVHVDLGDDSREELTLAEPTPLVEGVWSLPFFKSSSSAT